MALKRGGREDILAPQEVADLLLVSPVTVRQWANKGDLKALVTPGGHRRFTRRDVESFARQRGLTLHFPDSRVRRILVVDDDPQLSGYLVELFDSLSEAMEVETADNGFDAGRKVLAFRPDLVLLDLMMPGLDGFEVCRRIREDPSTRDVRIIAMTGYPSPGNIERIVSAGAEACLPKPIDTRALLKAIGLEPETTPTFSEQ